MNGCAVYSVACGVCTYVSIREQSFLKKAQLSRLFYIVGVSGCPFRFMLVTGLGCPIIIKGNGEV